MKNLFSKMALVVLVGISAQSAKAEEMTPAAKTIASLAVGGLSGYIFGEVYKQSAHAGGFIGGFTLVAGLLYLKDGRQDAVSKAFGPEYVGISALAAVGAAVATVKAK